MSDLEENFGPFAFYIEKLQKQTFDIPEALMEGLYAIVQAGLWNLPNRGKYEAIVKVRQWIRPNEWKEQIVKGWGLSPSALKNAFPKYDEEFVTTAWEKLGNRIEYKLRVYSMLLRQADVSQSEPNGLHPAINEIGVEARALKSSTDVVQSGLVTEFCEAILNREFAVLLSWAFAKDSYDWTWELAQYLTPLQESIRYLETPFETYPPRNRIIREAIDKEVLKRWGDDDVVANMRHIAGMCKGIEFVDSYRRTHDARTGDALCKVCVRNAEIYKAAQAFRDELLEKKIMTWQFPPFESVEDVARFREEVLRSEAELAERVENENETDETSEEEEAEDPFVEDVVRLVEGLTSLGVSPNKAAEVAAKLL